MIQVVAASTMSCCHIHSSGTFLHVNIVVVLTNIHYRARRNAQGHLEPDASEDVVQQSLGFGDYELAKKTDNTVKSSLPSNSTS
jgi:hypothetical protein